jgi:hypothetical protein
MPKPICVECQCFYRPEKNGYFLTEMMPIHEGALRGKRGPESWEPYKIWVGDLWKCPDCGHLIVCGFGAGPVSEHYMPDFEKLRKELNADQLTINDC